MFYDRLEVLCKKGGISPTKLAVELEIAPATITKWKNGSQPTADRIIKIAGFFGVSTDYLLEQSGSDPDLPEDEKQLLKNYRRADERGKKRIRNAAAEEAEETDQEPAAIGNVS